MEQPIPKKNTEISPANPGGGYLRGCEHDQSNLQTSGPLSLQAKGVDQDCLGPEKRDETEGQQQEPCA